MADKIDADTFLGLVKGTKSTPQSGPVSAENFQDIIKGAPKEQGLSWLDVPVQAITNVPKSAIEFGKGIYEAVTSPVQTAKGLLDIGAGALRNITPKTIADLIDQYDKNPEAAKKASDVASQVGKFYKERYGSSEGFKKALANDPVGVAADISAVFSGGATVAGAVGGPVSRLAQGLRTAAEVTNPLLVPGKVVQAVVPPALGLSTGVGTETVKRAAQAGFEGDKSFAEQLRKQASMTQPLEDARFNLDKMRENRSNAYRSGMMDISSDKSVLDFADIDNALSKAEKSISFKGKVKDDVASGFLQKIKDEVADWKTQNPAEFHTPEGLDALKQRIGAIVDRVPFEETNSARIGSDIYNSVKGTISRQAPKYSEVMKDYSEASDSIREIEKALSLKNKASSDTALRKLQSLTRDNVSTNYGARLSLAQQLEQEGGRPFINALAGQALSSPTARGMAGAVEGIGMLGSLIDPRTLIALPFQTPRAVGEAAYLGGRLAKPIYQAGQAVGATPARMNTLADLLNLQTQMNPQEPYSIDIGNMVPR